jgi:GNAT superfamily N-acetyltransferase
MANYLSENRSAMLMSWLQEATPDQWHQVADGWNWGSGCDILRWIVEQPDCDKGTALLIFWRGEPSYYWGEATDRDGLVAERGEYGLDVYDMLVALLARWRANGFTRAAIAYNPRIDWLARESDVVQSANHPALTISADMIMPLPGREIEGGEFNEGIPYHIERATV